MLQGCICLCKSSSGFPIYLKAMEQRMLSKKSTRTNLGLRFGIKTEIRSSALIVFRLFIMKSMLLETVTTYTCLRPPTLAYDPGEHLLDL